MVKRKDIDMLNTPESWQSPVAVIAHIDLDAFYAQCLGVRIGADPLVPLGCRQWNLLIAINYPSRKFGIKRGMSASEAKKLCPEILLPHVATFKKGEDEWAFHENPDAGTYKVSLDHFRRESRKIFDVFKRNFRIVQKAGIDEGYVDLGPDIYRTLLTTHADIFDLANPDDEVPLSYQEIIDIGAELVRKVRIEIHEELKYTCSAGIAPNKQLAKLGSGFKKPFNQTVVYPDNINDFLNNFPVTKIGGLGGKIGRQVLELLKVPETPSEQCKYIRETYPILVMLERALKGDVGLAKDVYYMVRGGLPSEVADRVTVKSMIAVKNFRGAKLKTKEDVEQWLKVYSADITGRLADLDPTDGTVLVPKTISLRKDNQSKQQPFELKGISIPEIKEQIYQQSVRMAHGFVTFPCPYLATEVSNFYEIPRERLMFQKFKIKDKLSTSKTELGSETAKASPASMPEPVPEPVPGPEKADLGPLFVEDDIKCERCNKRIPLNDAQSHSDWHFARDLQQSQTRQSPTKRSSPVKSPAKGKKKKKGLIITKDQKNILDFFKK